jgi:hypothetical protein
MSRVKEKRLAWLSLSQLFLQKSAQFGSGFNEFSLAQNYHVIWQYYKTDRSAD